MFTVEEALASLARVAGPSRPRPESVPLDEVLGRVLYESVVIDHDVPPFPKATMDGFAVADGVVAGAELRVRGRVIAGEWPDAPVVAGTAFRIMTGAPLPDGTGRVIPFEWTTEIEGGVRIDALPSRDPYFVLAGTHARAGDVVLAPGTALGPGAVGVLATAGCEEVVVAQRPVVAVLGTGSEIVEVGAQPTRGTIRNSNAFMLQAQVRRAGGLPLDLGVVRDDGEELGRAVRRGLEADILLVSGGVSRGDLDLVPDAFEAAGVEQIFHRWRVQPGGPLYCGHREGTIVLGLPGNPAASFVGFELLGVPATRHRLGGALEARPTLRARYRGPWGRAAPRRRYRPAELVSDEQGRLLALSRPWSGSGDPLVAARARALVAIPEDTEPPPEDRVRVDVLPVEPLA